MLHELALKHNASGSTPLQLLAKMLTQDVQCKAHHQGLYLMLAAAASQCLASPMDALNLLIGYQGALPKAAKGQAFGSAP